MSGLIIKNREIGTGRPAICVPVMDQKQDKIIEEITYLASSSADIIEWRVDAFENFRDYNAIRDILAAIKPVLKEKIFLYTFRSRKQGGMAEADTELLDDLHELAAESDTVNLVDLEYFEEERPVRKIRQLQARGIKVVASHHDFEQTPPPEVMKMLLEKMCAGGADIVKLAVMPRNLENMLTLLKITEQFHKENPDTPIITMAMGKIGRMSRLCGEDFGSCVTFGAHKTCSAPGQFEMNQLATVLDIIHSSNENGK